MKKKKIIAFIAALSCMVIAGCSNAESSSSPSDNSSYVSTDSASSEDGSSPSSSEPEPSSSEESSTPDSSEPDSSVPDSSEPDSSSAEPDSSSTEPESSSSEPLPEIEVSISGEEAMVTGRSQVVSASVANAVSDSSVSYSTGSGNSDVISVDADGNVTAVSAGTDTVIATSNEDSSKSASLSITVSDPVFDSSAIDITTNYTAVFTSGDQSILMIVNDQGWVLSSDGNVLGGYWFDNGNAYSISMDTDGAYYIDMNNPDADWNPDSVLAQFNMATYVQSSTWAFYSYENGVDTFSADSDQAITKFIGGMSSCDQVLIRNTDEEGPVLTLMYNGAVNATLSFENVGSTVQSIDPEYRYFDEGGEAGDNDGAGEDW